MTMTSFDSSVVAALALEDFKAAASSIAKDVVYTPVLPHFVEGRFQGVHLKAECLQPLGSFKIRGASYVAGQLDALGSRRIATASMGNFAQGLALAAQRRALSLTVHVPENAARIKVAALHRFGATVVEHPFDTWWEIMTTRETGADDGVFVHPVCEQGVIAGNGSIGLEIAAQLPDVETVVVPFGGGGLVCGIALALRACGHRARGRRRSRDGGAIGSGSVSWRAGGRRASNLFRRRHRFDARAGTDVAAAEFIGGRRGSGLVGRSALRDGRRPAGESLVDRRCRRRRARRGRPSNQVVRVRRDLGRQHRSCGAPRASPRTRIARPCLS